jgi:hypothetical protein
MYSFWAALVVARLVENPGIRRQRQAAKTAVLELNENVPICNLDIIPK